MGADGDTTSGRGFSTRAIRAASRAPRVERTPEDADDLRPDFGRAFDAIQPMPASPAMTAPAASIG